jgi:hypothetical protein
VSRNLTVNGSTFSYPDAGEPKGWGEDATLWAQEVTDLLSDLKGPTFSVSNNQAVAANITGLAFDSASVRSAIIQYSIYRVTNSNELAETGQLFLIYKNNANTWTVSRQFFGDDAGVTISITTGGQLQYTSTNVTGTGYSGEMTFRAQTLNQ